MRMNVKKRYKNILLCGCILIAMTVFWSACTEKEGTPVLSEVTPTVTVTTTPTLPPVSTQVVTPTIKPTKEPENTKKPTLTPTGELQQHITPIVGVTVTMSPTPIPTSTPKPTVTPTTKPVLTVTPTVIPTPTNVIEPDVTPTITPVLTVIPTITPIQTVTPTPTVDPLSLVYAGWQQTEDLSGTRSLVFPELYDTVNLLQDKDYFTYVYTASKHPELVLEMSFYTEEDITVWKKKIAEQYPDVKIKAQMGEVAYYTEEGDIFAAGVLYEYDYKSLGVSGVMRIENRYPKQFREEYQKEQYAWYVCISEQG